MRFSLTSQYVYRLELTTENKFYDLFIHTKTAQLKL